MSEIDTPTFHAGIFMSDCDMIAPVIVPGPQGMQTTGDFFRAHQQARDVFFPWAATAGIGQYSLRGASASLLTKIIDDVRLPTGAELVHSRDYDGEQLGGDRKLVRTIMLSRVVKGDRPKDLYGLVEDLDLATVSGTELVPQHYEFFHATNEGDVYQHPLMRDLNTYSPEEMVLLGKISYGESPEVMGFWPDGGKERIDYAPAISAEFRHAWALDHAMKRTENYDHILTQVERVMAARLFKLPESQEIRALMLEDPMVGCSAGVCSNCYHPVAFCNNACPSETGGCGYDFGSLVGPSIDVWETLSKPDKEKWGYSHCREARDW